MASITAPRVKFTTLGCRLNQAESDSMAEQLGARGLLQVGGGEPADVVVVNTCTVTREATKASRTAIRRSIRDHPDARIVVVGCYAVSDPKEIEAIEGVDLVLGNDVKESFAQALETATPTAPLLQIGFRTEPGRAVVPARVRANLKVQTGCDEWCSFCIIPTTRGPLRSFDEDSLVSEARSRIAAGAREVVLTGVHLGKYRYESGGDERDLVRLLRRLLDIEGLWRVRLSSILSNHLTDGVVNFMAGEPRICRHLHVPLQSGDDGTLRAMNRPYDSAQYRDAISRVKAAMPEVALATDIIVGFPGETDEAFEETMIIVQAVGFSKLHVFRYSARRGTAAIRLGAEIHPDVKRARSKRLIDLGNEIRTRFLSEHLRNPIEVLVEDERTVEGVTVASGQTSDHVRVWFEGRDLLGKMVEVAGERVRSNGIAGRLVRMKRG